MALKLPIRQMSAEGWWPNTYDVLVYQEGGHIYAKNRNGKVICVDSQTACLQEAINHVTSGGLIFIKPGIYNIYKTVYIEQQNSNITIMGSGRSTVLKSYKTGDPPYMLRLNWAKGVTLRDFAVDGNGIAYENVRESLMSFNAPTDLSLINLECFNTNTGACIDIGYANLVHMEGLYLHDSGSVKKSDGIHVGFSKFVYLYNSHIENNSDAGIAFDNSQNVVVEDNFFFYNGAGNIMIWSMRSDVLGTIRTLIAGNHIAGKVGIWVGKEQNVTSVPESVHIVGNYIWDTDIGIRIDVGGVVQIVGNLIRRSTVAAIKTAGWFVDISNNVITDSNVGIDSQSNTTHIRNNIFLVVNTPISGAYRVVDNNIPFYSPTVLNRNSGQATIPANSTRVTVQHGLFATPSKVLITPLGSPPGKLWVENITATGFDIVTDTAPTADLRVAWYAEV